MIKVPLIPLVAIAHTINYLNLSTDGVVMGVSEGSLKILSTHPEGDFVYAQLACTEGDLPFARYTQESLYQLRSKLAEPLPSVATIMPGAILVGEKVITLEGEPHEPVGLPDEAVGAAAPLSISGRMLVTASHICQTFQVEKVRFIRPTLIQVSGPSFDLVIKGERIG